MSRRQVFKVVDYPPCAAGVEYRGRVLRVRKEPRADKFRVILELLDKEQEGRCVEFTISFPIRPLGLTSSFFLACGLVTAVGAEIDLQEAVGKVVFASFEQGPGCALLAASFRPFSAELSPRSAPIAPQDEPHHSSKEQP